SNNDTFISNNPFKPSKILGEFVNSNRNDVQESLQSSQKSFENWSKTSAPKRVEILRDAIQQIENNKDKLAEIMTEEQGKPLQESKGEITKSISEGRFMIGEGLRLYGQTAPSEKDNSWTKTTRVPIGPIVAITPWNFP